MTDTSEKMTALTQLAGTVAHELNNIFTAVVGNLNLLDLARASPDGQGVLVQDVARAAQRGIELTAKLQAFAGRQQLSRKYVDLNALVLQTMRNLRTDLPLVHVNIMLTDAKLVVHIDEEKLSDTIVELVKNALDAMPPKGGTITIETALRAEHKQQPWALLKLKDSGQGMTPEVLARAAEPLFTTCPRGLKAGWGLSKSTGFITQSGGQMSLSSRLYHGTLIEIELPLATEVEQHLK
jgi:C4-dicarboxylate-specific signal transduction histidine kinase